LPIARLWRMAFAVAVVAGMGGCTLPWQQLQLPTPPPPAVEGPSASKQGGAPLAKISTTDTVNEVVGTGPLTGHPLPRRVVNDSKDGVTLDLADASIAEAAKSILGDVLGVNYVVSEKVKGSITIQTNKAVPKEALLEIFETVLRGEGAAIVVQQGVYRIVPASEAVAAARLYGKGANYRRIPGVSTHVVALQHVSATEMERILKAMAPNANILRTDANRNLLVVSGTRADLDGIMDTVSVFDVDWMRGMSFGIYPVESADPEAIAQELDTVFNDKDGPGKGIVRIIPNRRLKSVLVISSRPQYLHRAQNWLKRLDMATRATVKQVFVYPVRNRTANELARLLQRVYSQQDQAQTAPKGLIPLIPAPQPGVALPTPSPQPSPAPEADASQPPAAPPTAPPATPPLATEGPRDDRSGAISVVADETNNSLVITATALEYRRACQILERIDVAPNQILLEATIAEVQLKDELKMGVRWFFQAGNNQLTLTDSLTGAVTPTFPGFSNFFSTPNVKVVLNALSRITDVNIISSPTLMVVDNKRATLQVGNEVPVATQSAVAVLTPGSPIVNSITYRNTGIVLNITPHIGDKGRIQLEVEQEASDVVPTLTSGIDSPTIQQRRIRTTVAVNDGEGIVLGGLIQDRADNTRGQVPLIGQIPVLGTLFKNKEDTISRTELLVAITPRIIKDSAQVRAIAEEFRSRINLTTRPQRQAPPDRREQLDRLLR
jgi:general secretion pathway protein D